MLKYMLDTNIIIYTMKNKPAEVKQAFKLHYGHLCISSVSLMELVYSAERSARPEKNLEILEGFAARVEVLPYDQRAAHNTGQLRAELSGNGTPIGPYDQMIAGHARSEGLILVTNNMKEFKRVAGLRLENWVR